MIEPKGRGKAEVACRSLLQDAVERRDFARVAEVLEQYGNYLLLMEAA